MARDSKGRFVKVSSIEVIKAYKAFDKDLKCRNFQYEVGKTYIHNGKIEACNSGFHSCENPFDVLNYYNLTDCRYAAVSVSGSISRHGNDSKIASGNITINAEIKLPEFIKTMVSWLIKSCKKDNQIQAASGNFSKLAASGNYSQLAASGDSSKLAASGNFSKLAASGNFSQLAASGDYSQLAASGNYSQLAASGDSSVAISSGTNNRVKTGKKGTMALTRWIESEERYRITVAYVGENGIKADTWYKLDENGEFKEVAE